MMRKTKRFGAVLFAAVLLSPAVARAERKTWVGGNLGMMGGNEQISRALTGGLQAGTQSGRFGGSVHVFRYSDEVKSNALTPNTITLLPVMANAFGVVPLGRDAQFRLGGGVSYVHVTHESSLRPESVLNSLGYTGRADVKSGIGYQVSGGLDLLSGRNYSVGLDVTYLFFNPDMDLSVTRILDGQTESSSGNFRLDTVIATMTLKFYTN